MFGLSTNTAYAVVRVGHSGSTGTTQAQLQLSTRMTRKWLMAIGKADSQVTYGDVGRALDRFPGVDGKIGAFIPQEMIDRTTKGLFGKYPSVDRDWAPLYTLPQADDLPFPSADELRDALMIRQSWGNCSVNRGGVVGDEAKAPPGWVKASAEDEARVRAIKKELGMSQWSLAVPDREWVTPEHWAVVSSSVMRLVKEFNAIFKAELHESSLALSFGLLGGRPFENVKKAMEAVAARERV